MKRFKSLLLLLMLALQTLAQPADSLQISLITCSPGPKVYSLYGHTAIRCQNFTRGADWVFNYGVFSFTQPNFIWRFVLGKCDYMVEAIPWKYFLTDYEDRGSSVTAQVLDLSPTEAYRIFYNLIENCRPENCEYRYNFFYNNCTTKARDMIECSVEGDVEYTSESNKKTFRQILHEYTNVNPWSGEGNDMLLGASVDTLLDDRSQMFAPEYMMRYLDGAVIRDEKGNARPLVKRTDILLAKKEQPVELLFPLSPLACGWILLAFSLIIVCIEYLTRHMFWIWDVLLLFLQGCAGTVLVFMFLFSQHPSVDTNWLVWLFNPIAFLGIPLVVKAAWHRRKTLWHAYNFTVLTLFIVFSPWIPQDFGDIVVPLALILLSRPISYYLFYQRNQRTKVKK